MKAESLEWHNPLDCVAFGQSGGLPHDLADCSTIYLEKARGVT